MSTIWAIADPHFGHKALIERTVGYLNSPLRTGFSSSEEMDEFLIERINSVVRPPDTLYILGDVALKKRDIQTAKRLNGHKRLIGGNHDTEDLKTYREAGFEKVLGCRVLSGVVFTHVPIHPSSLSRWIGNAHGHIHDAPTPVGQYVCLCVEKTDYLPLALEDIIGRLISMALDVSVDGAPI